MLDAILLCCFAALVWRAESFPTGKRVAIATQLQASCNLAKPMGIATYVSVRFWFKGVLLQVQYHSKSQQHARKFAATLVFGSLNSPIATSTRLMLAVHPY